MNKIQTAHDAILWQGELEASESFLWSVLVIVLIIYAYIFVWYLEYSPWLYLVSPLIVQAITAVIYWKVCRSTEPAQKEERLVIKNQPIPLPETGRYMLEQTDHKGEVIYLFPGVPRN